MVVKCLAEDKDFFQIYTPALQQQQNIMVEGDTDHL